MSTMTLAQAIMSSSAAARDRRMAAIRAIFANLKGS